MGKSKCKLIHMFFVTYADDGFDKTINQVIDEPLQNVLLVRAEHLENGKTELLTRTASSLNGVHWFLLREDAIAGEEV
jgi:hypothetical protein